MDPRTRRAEPGRHGRRRRDGDPSGRHHGRRPPRARRRRRDRPGVPRGPPTSPSPFICRRDRLAGRAPGAARTPAGPVRRRPAGGQHRRALPVLAPARAGQAAGPARPLRRPARPAGAAGPFRLPDPAVVRRAGLRRRHRGRPRHPRPGPRLGARGSRRPGRAGARGSGRRARCRRGPLRRPGHRPGRHPRLVLRWLPGRAGGAAPPGRVPRRDRGRASHRLAAVRHPLHRALPGFPR